MGGAMNMKLGEGEARARAQGQQIFLCGGANVG